ncbi:MAG TPA: hypothetical protein DCR40_18040 [Prolixibacteraceae bacterium]|nr:hypothetical protein [Prolixibacteraceae bacterium]
MSNYISLALNLIFGSGFIISLITLRSQQKKAGSEAKGAEATAESTELDNVEKAIKIWREMAENLKAELTVSNEKYDAVAKKVEGLRKDVQKLNYTNQKILKLLDKISHDNLETTVAEIKEEIKKSDV